MITDQEEIAELRAKERLQLPRLVNRLLIEKIKILLKLLIKK